MSWKPITKYNTCPSFAVFLLNWPVSTLSIFTAIEHHHASRTFFILILLRIHILTVSTMTSLSVTETWKHFRRTLYQHVNLSLYFCFASRFPPKLGHIRHPWYVSHARLVLHKRMHLTRTLWPFCCDYNPVLKRWSCLLLYFGFLCSYLRKNIAYVFLIC